MLRRIRIGFIVLALLLLAPLGFLIGRTLDTLDRERELQHAAVANRVFDEAEGALAGFLREEQARPADAYRASPSGGPWMESQPEFVRAYFQIDPQGRIRTSASEPDLDAALRVALTPAQLVGLERSTPEAKRSAGADDTIGKGDAPSGSLGTAAGAPARRVAPLAEAEPGALLDHEALEQKKEKAPAPGTARNVQSIDLITGRAKAGKADTSEAEADDDASYSSSRALEALGQIAKSTAREEAKPRSMPETRSQRADADYEGFERGADFVRLDATTSLRARVAPPQPGTLETAEAEEVVRLEVAGMAEVSERTGAAAPDEKAGLRDVAALDRPAEPRENAAHARQAPAAAPPTPAAIAPDRAPLALAPSRLSGERIDDGRLLLYRTALDDTGRAVRQGMLVSIDELGSWLTRRVLGESELRGSLALELRASSVAATAPLPADRYVYAYRFAEPFEMLSLQLAISPLDDGDNARNIGWLSALLIAASTLGLYAVYRMAAVAVHFAERRSNFAAAVTHELKTPLTAIRMYGEMLRDGMVTDEAKRSDYYETITRESERLTRLIDNVLEWSKLEKHQREASLVTGDPSGAIREVVEVVGPHAEAQGFVVAPRLPAALPFVRHDADALQQILYNLIDNAIKYARGHEPARVEVEAEPADDGVAIRVRDHGPGVSADKLPLVFEAFYRGEDELTRETKGTGIGLALARALAESMEGRLIARNHPDGGLEVELRLSAG